MQSQDEMLDRLGDPALGGSRDAIKEAYRNDIVAARLVNAFLGGGLDETTIVTAVNEELYRNRA